MDPSVLYEAAWGDIRLYVCKLQWESGNTQVIHDLASGDDHPMQPRGKRLQTASVELIFDDFPDAKERGVDAYRRLQAAVGERRIFTHPIEGSFYARIGKFNPSVDDSSIITVDCEFIPDTGADPVSPVGPSTTITSGKSAVASASRRVEQSMEAAKIGFPSSALSKMNFRLSIRQNVTVGFSANVSLGVSANLSASATASATATATASGSASASATASVAGLAFADVYTAAFAAAQTSALADETAIGSSADFALAYAAAAITADARETVDAWSADPALSLRTVQIDAARMSQSLSDLINAGELERHLELWPCFQSVILMGESVRAAAIAATSDTPRVFTVVVRTRTSLLPLAAQIYGGLQARDRAAQIVALNDIKTPAWLDPGTYLMPARDPASLPNLSATGAR